jgi:hypothetical protein
MRPDSTEKVLEKLATSEKATLVIERRLTEKCVSRQALGIMRR